MPSGFLVCLCCCNPCYNMLNKLYFTFVICGCLSLIPEMQAQANDYEVVTDQFLRLRSKPSTAAAALDTLYLGDIVSGLDSVNQYEKKMLWLRCRTKEGKTGFAAIRSGSEIYLRKKNNWKDYFICSYTMLGILDVKSPELNQLITTSNEYTDEVKYVLRDIEHIIGIKLDLQILESPDLKDNCVSLRYHNQPYIIFSPKFFIQISNLYRNPEPLYAVLGHEVAHHLKDDLRREGVMVFDEMEADYYSGKILKNIGLDEKELEIAIKFMDNYPEGKSHPPVTERKRKVRQGWQDTPAPESGKAIRTRLQKTYDNVSVYKNGFSIVKRDGLYGYINQIGREVFSPQFLEAREFDDNKVAKVKKSDGQWYTVTPYGKFEKIN